MLGLAIAVLLSIGAVDALIPLMIIIVLIVAAAGASRGYSIFNIFGIATLAGVGAGRGSIQGRSALGRYFIVANPVGVLRATSLPRWAKAKVNARRDLKAAKAKALERARGGPKGLKAEVEELPHGVKGKGRVRMALSSAHRRSQQKENRPLRKLLRFGGWILLPVPTAISAIFRTNRYRKDTGAGYMERTKEAQAALAERRGAKGAIRNFATRLNPSNYGYNARDWSRRKTELERQLSQYGGGGVDPRTGRQVRGIVERAQYLRRIREGNLEVVPRSERYPNEAAPGWLGARKERRAEKRGMKIVNNSPLGSRGRIEAAETHLAGLRGTQQSMNAHANAMVDAETAMSAASARGDAAGYRAAKARYNSAEKDLESTYKGFQRTTGVGSPTPRQRVAPIPMGKQMIETARTVGRTVWERGIGTNEHNLRGWRRVSPQTQTETQSESARQQAVREQGFGLAEYRAMMSGAGWKTQSERGAKKRARSSGDNPPAS